MVVELPKIMEAHHQSELEKITDEDIENKVEDYIDKHGYKMHDLSMENECLTHGQVVSIIYYFLNKLKQ